MNCILEGNIAIKAAILANKRKIQKLMIDQHKLTKNKDTRYIFHLAKKQGIDIEICSLDQIQTIATGTTHGGILAFASEITFQTFTTAIDTTFMVYLEGIEDPYNFGQMIRSLYASGCQTIVTRKRDWSSVSSILSKASAGAYEYISIVQIENTHELIDFCKVQHIPIVCAIRTASAISVYEYQFPKSFCLAIGGEMRGLASIIKNSSNQNVFIPYANQFKNAMSASACASILGFEIMRQKHFKQL